METSSDPLQWIIGESIVCEMDLLLYMLCGGQSAEYYSVFFGNSDSHLKKIESLNRALRDFAPETQLSSPWLYRFALPLGLIHEVDYQTLSLQLRKHTFEELCALQVSWFKSHPLPNSVAIAPENQWHEIVDVMQTSFLDCFAVEEHEITVEKSAIVKERQKAETFLTKIFRGGEWEYEFWQWMDRMYYDFYQPWRESQSHELERQKNEALKNLESMQGTGVPPLKWLENRQPLLSRACTSPGLEAWGGTLHFVATPYRMGDFFCQWSHYVGLSLSDNAFQKDEFIKQVSSVASLTRAISDPTRLMILRCIRHYGYYTTELASFLNLSRPTVSEHCKILRNAGLIETYPVGRKSFHKLRPETVQLLFKELENLFELFPSD